MSVHDYTEILKVLETLKCTACRTKSNIVFNREFDLHLGNSRGISA
jgi:hypothetical protein